MSTRRTIAITGATGFLGSALVQHFSNKGDKIIALVRARPSHPLPGVHYELFDLSNGKCSAQQIVADVLIHAAYVPVTSSSRAFEANTNGTMALLKLFAPDTRKIFISSLSADENSPAIYGRQKAALEKIFIEQHGAIIRPGLILGNGGMFANMRDYLKKKSNIPIFNGGQQPVQTVYVQDLVLAIDKLTSAELNGTFTFCEHEPVHYKEFYSELCKQLGVKPRFISIPFWVAECVVACADSIGITLPINKDNLQGLKLMSAKSTTEDILRLGITPGNYKENLKRAMQASA